MPINFVRSDITKVRADAIVNSTNPQLECAGLGVDASIHASAGPELAEALRKIGSCEIGSAVMTPSFQARRCKMIFHAVAPVYEGGQNGEEALLRRCYRRIFALAKENHCASLAMPILSAGAYGYPKADAYRIATEEATGFLYNNDEMVITIVLFGKQLTEIARAVEQSVDEYITDDYARLNEDDLLSFYETRSRDLNARPAFMQEAVPLPCEEKSILGEADLPLPCAAPIKKSLAGYDPESKKVKLSTSFGLEVDRLMEEKGIKTKDFYVAANISKSVLSKMRKEGSTPMKYTALACAIGLRLNIEETEDLLRHAGYCLSDSNSMDVIVSHFIRKKMFNIYSINLVLFEKGVHPLGAK